MADYQEYRRRILHRRWRRVFIIVALLALLALLSAIGILWKVLHLSLIHISEPTRPY